MPATHIALIKILKPFNGHKPGDKIRTPSDIRGTPLDADWRRRLRDAERDNCCELLSQGKGKKS